MVLRWLVFTFIIIGSIAPSYANRSSKIYFRKAQILFKNKKYAQSLKALNRGYNFKKPKTIPASALFLIAYNFKKLGKYRESNYFYNRLIRNIYLRKHISVIKAYKKNILYELEVPRTLGMTYFHLGENHFRAYLATKKVQSALKARMYIKICDEMMIANQCTGMLEKINSIIAEAKLQRKKFEFYLQASRLLFQDRVEIEENSSGISSSLVANNSSVCYGAGLRYGSSYKGWDFNGCIFSGTTTVQGVASSESGTDFEYKQSGVPIAGMVLESGYYYLLDNQKGRLGAYGTLLYRAGSYSEPTGYVINDPNNYYLGVSFLASLKIPLVELQSKLAHLSSGIGGPGKINSLALNVVYNF